MINKVVAFIVCMFCLPFLGLAQDYDVYIKGAVVFDGSGGDSVLQDVGIRGERIVYVGPEQSGARAKQTIDAKGLYLAPGFIDPHTHYRSQLNHKNKENRALLRALKQGVTTVFEGNDGNSPLYTNTALKKWEDTGIGPNAALFIGHNTVRKKVLGTKDIQPTAKELEDMKNWVDKAMKAGAFGISTGLFYNPGNFAETSEVVELCRVVASYDGIHDTHQRDEGSQNIGVVNSTKEIIDIGRKSGVRTHFSHIKVAGPKAWGLSTTLIDLIEKARAEGIDVTANQYPYIASKTGLSSALVPAWVRDGGIKAMRERFKDPALKDSILNGIVESINARTADASKLMLSQPGKEYHNKSLAEVAEEYGISPEEAVMEICSENSPSVLSFMMKEEDVVNFMTQPWVMVGSDGGSGHPRGFGTFARVVQEYALKRNVLSLSEAIYKSTHFTASTMRVKDRGLIKEGYYADIMLFDPQRISANSSYEDGELLASGVDYVLVNGQLVIEHEEWTNNLPGKSLRFNQ